jgi:ATP-dependent DNA helicase RecG
MPINSIRNLDQPVDVLPSVGQSYAQKLTKLNIFTLNDLLHHYPFRYSDVSAIKTIDQLEEGETITLSGTILGIKSVYLRSGKTIQRATFSDGTGTLELTWFNQPYLVKTLTNNPQVSLSGKTKLFGRKLTISAPQYEIQKASNLGQKLHTGRLVPVYPETAGVSSKWIRTKINHLLKLLPPTYETIPQEIIQEYRLLPLAAALNQIHFPESQVDYDQAKRRLSFDELLSYQFLSQMRKRQSQSLPNHFPLSVKRSQLQDFINTMPFTLTSGQNQAISDIVRDLSEKTPMNRLIQGDVGSGKTAVAAAAAFAVIKSGYKVIFMVPTETLANQHFSNLTNMFESLQLKLALATKSSRQDLSSADLVIGTHAVLHRQLPNPIGLVIVDEQHRFGVKQRSQLIDVSRTPHVLSLTATPIPRTIALTLYSELDITAIKDMPEGRLPVKTYVVSNNKRQDAYNWIRGEIAKGNQAFVVCPLIYSQEDPSQNEVKSAEAEYLRLSQEVFPDLKIGLIHGKLSSKEKDKAITQFANKEFDILVATPVIEVGIDIKNATIIVIEGAERFGLASLHQLRGRVGRGEVQSHCLLFPTKSGSQSLARLKELEKHHNGLELAEIDLNLRGQGDLYGIRQSGHIDLKIASLHDLEIIEISHQAAKKMLAKDPHLDSIPHIKSLIKNNGLCYNT